MDLAIPNQESGVALEPRHSRKKLARVGAVLLVVTGAVGLNRSEVPPKVVEHRVVASSPKKIELNSQLILFFKKVVENQREQKAMDQELHDTEQALRYIASFRDSLPKSPATEQASANVQEFLSCTRAHESDNAGGYQAVSPDGIYHGAYQFDQSTWDSTASSHGRLDLVGQDPAQVAPPDQDKMATDLYEGRGNAPWGGRC